MPGTAARKGVLEVKQGGAAAAADWVRVDQQNFDGFVHSWLRGEFQNAGAGATTHQIDGHTEADGSFTVSDTEVTRPLFWDCNGRRIGFRWSPEGTTAGQPTLTFDAFVQSSKTAAARGAIRYGLTLTVEDEPTRATH
ncbi:MAG: hypothetical protein OXC29_23225 [Rhodococcus sp.]|nr:hypothetical protein [Rhodococcus sp. (in: high G+C Gram-positive bacteria)]